MKNELKEIILCKENLQYFCKNYVYVLHPEKGLINFELYPFQYQKVVPAFESKRFIILKKFRQAGLSTLASIYSLWKCLFYTDQRILMISITDRDAKNLMSMIRIAWEKLPDWMKCNTIEFSQHVIKLDTGSEIKCGTPKMGRGYSANIIVVDEAAFIPNMYEVWKAIFPTISAAGNNCKVFIISTVNGVGNWYSDIYHDAQDGKNDFYCIDLDYREHPEYNNPEYIEKMKSQLGLRGWEQEVLGIFLSGSDTFIKPDAIKRVEKRIKDNNILPRKFYNDKLWIWYPPEKNKSYILCADVAEGLGGEHDYSAFHILDISTLEQVAEFCDNTISTYEYAKVINEIGNKYNQAIIVVENNALGVGVLEKLYNDLDYANLYRSRLSKKNIKLGFTMTNQNRALVLNTFSNLIENDLVKINSNRLLNEIMTFEFNQKTKRAEARYGRKDDLILSFAIGLFARNHIIYSGNIILDDSIKSEEFVLDFDNKYENILPENNNSIIDNFFYNSTQIEIIENEDPDSEESLLKEFGWIN